MGNLKIKITLGSFDIELDGSSEEVISQFAEIKKNGLGQMVDQLVPLMRREPLSKDIIRNEESVHDNTVEISPKELGSGIIQKTSLQDAVLRLLPKSETEWVLVYGYFCITQGKDTFTRQDIIEKYKDSNRLKDSNLKNLSASIKGAANKRWIHALNNTDYILTEDGRSAVSEILARTKPTVKQPKKRKPKEEVKIKSEVTGE